MPSVSGKIIMLDDDGPRSVWLGRVDDQWCLTFTAADGEKKKLRLSFEAMDALIYLHKHFDDNQIAAAWRIALITPLNQSAT